MKKRDIILIPIPFTDLSEKKLRPALILGTLQDDLLCCFLSSQLQTKGRYDVLIKKDHWNRLKTDSVIKCGKIFTLHQSLVQRRLGKIDSRTYTTVTHKIIQIIQ